MRINLVATVALGVTAISCTASEPAEERVDTGSALEWELSPEPELQIGVVDGAPDYQMHNMVSALAMPNGNTAVLNAGSHELRLYDGSGRLISHSGGRGGGPGEFLNPLRMYLLGDTLAVLDPAGNRLSLHDSTGEFIRSRPITRERGRFQWDEWLYDMSWIDGPRLGVGRGVIARAIQRLPAPDTSEGYRYVRVTPYGHLWVRQPSESGVPMRTWNVHDTAGAHLARIEIPADFEIYDAGTDYLIGRARDSLGVEYLRKYRLDTKGMPMVLDYFRGDSSDIAYAAGDPAVTGELKASLRMLAGAQETYYADPANNYRYAADHRTLKGYTPEDGVEIRMVSANATGWMAVAMHRASKAMCGISFGPSAPVGWTPGVAMCL